MLQQQYSLIVEQLARLVRETSNQDAAPRDGEWAWRLLQCRFHSRNYSPFAGVTSSLPYSLSRYLYRKRDFNKTVETIISNNYRRSNNILTIVYNHKSMITVWSLRMRIHFRWDTMSCPTSMCNTNMTMNLWVEINIRICKKIMNFNQCYLSLCPQIWSLIEWIKKLNSKIL